MGGKRLSDHALEKFMEPRKSELGRSLDDVPHDIRGAFETEAGSSRGRYSEASYGGELNFD